MTKTTPLVTSENRIVDTYIIIPDPHIEYIDWPAYMCVLKAVEIVRPTGILWLGDIGEWAGASHWQWKKKRRPPLEYQLLDINRDIKIVNERLDIADEQFENMEVQTKHMLQGNHDLWMDSMVEENPHLQNTKHRYGRGYMFKDAISCIERGYAYHPLGKLFEKGSLNFYHGHLVGGIDHARQHLLKMGVSVMYGHTHDVQRRTVTHADGVKAAWSIGCLKRMDHAANKFLQRRPTNWSHAFAIVNWWSRGRYSVNVVDIIDGCCTVYGHHIDGAEIRKRGL